MYSKQIHTAKTKSEWHSYAWHMLDIIDITTGSTIESGVDSYFHAEMEHVMQWHSLVENGALRAVNFLLSWCHTPAQRSQRLDLKPMPPCWYSQKNAKSPTTTSMNWGGHCMILKGDSGFTLQNKVTRYVYWEVLSILISTVITCEQYMKRPCQNSTSGSLVSAIDTTRHIAKTFWRNRNVKYKII